MDINEVEDFIRRSEEKRKEIDRHYRRFYRGVTPYRIFINSKLRAWRLSEAKKKGTHTKDEWIELRDFFGHCVICGASEEQRGLEKDHIVPLMFGGSDHITNIQPVCAYCNVSKNDMIDYRIIYCKKHNLDMPLKWIKND